MWYDKIKTITYVCGIVFLLMGFAGKPSQETKSSESYESGEDPIMIVGASKEQSDAFQIRRQKIHEQWEHIRKGSEFEDAGELDLAIKEYNIALKLAKTKGDEGVPRRSLLDLYEKKGNYRLALEHLNQLIILKPSLAIKYAEKKQNLLRRMQVSNLGQASSAS